MTYSKEDLISIFQGLELSIAAVRLQIDTQPTPEGRTRVAKKIKNLRDLSQRVQSNIRVFGMIAEDEASSES